MVGSPDLGGYEIIDNPRLLQKENVRGVVLVNEAEHRRFPGGSVRSLDATQPFLPPGAVTVPHRWREFKRRVNDTKRGFPVPKNQRPTRGGIRQPPSPIRFLGVMRPAKDL